MLQERGISIDKDVLVTRFAGNSGERILSEGCEVGDDGAAFFRRTSQPQSVS